MSDFIKRLLDWVMPASVFVTIAEAQAYLGIAVSLATLLWFGVRFYDRFILGKKDTEK